MMRSGRGGSEALRQNVDLLFGCIFGLAAVLWLAQGLRTATPVWDVVADSRFWLVGSIGVLFFAGLRFHVLRLVEPYVFLLIALIPFFQAPESVFGFGLFAVGAIMLYVDGHMRRHPVVKMVLLGSYLLFLIVIASVVTASSLEQTIGVLVFMLGFFLYLFLTFLDKIIVFVKAEKPVVFLSSKGLTNKETTHLLALVRGRSVKEIAWDQGVKDSTVRNSLARSYHKLGFTDKAQLFQWAENYTLEP